MQGSGISVIVEWGRYSSGTRRCFFKWNGRGWRRRPPLLYLIPRHISCEATNSYPSLTMVLFDARSINNETSVLQDYLMERDTDLVL